MVPDLDGKRLELLKVARVALLWQPGGRRGNLSLTEMEAVAKALGVKLLSLEVRSLDDFEGAFAQAKRERAQTLITTTGSLIATQQRQVLDFAAKNRLPAIYPQTEYVDEGGLMSYGADYADLFRRAAVYVDKILKGAKPADLPVQQATKFEFVINLKAAKQIGLTLSPEFLSRANKVIR
jgi:putative ABC transport system substrate-binding protein